MTMKSQSLFLAVKSLKNSYHTVGMLEKQGEDYLFRYTKGIEGVLDSNKESLGRKYNPLGVEFPETHRVYRSKGLFFFFADYVMPPSRPDYKKHLEELDLDKVKDPDVFDILSISLGGEITDTYEIFPKLVKQEGGTVECKFFLRCRHIEDAMARIEKLNEGDRVIVEREEKNPHTDKPAFKVMTEQGEHIGYCPRYLVDDILAMTDYARDCSFSLKRRNGTKNRPKVIIKMEARLNGYEPMSSDEYQPLVEAE